jgi:hypothetical protein
LQIQSPENVGANHFLEIDYGANAVIEVGSVYINEVIGVWDATKNILYDYSFSSRSVRISNLGSIVQNLPFRVTARV